MPMTLLLMLLCLLDGPAVPTPADVLQDGIRIRTTIAGQLYRWELTNGGEHPVRSFRISNCHTYNHKHPDGWKNESTGDALLFSTDDPLLEIKPRQTAVFSARVTSSGGAVLGIVPLDIGIAGGDQNIHFVAVWGPVPQPASRLAMIVLVMLLLSILAAWRAGRLTRSPLSA